MTQLMEKKKGQSESSASGPSGDLPLVPCPKCDVKMIWAVSGSSKNQGKEYYKCPNNDGKYSSGCDTFMWKDQYEIYLAGLYFKEREKTEGCRLKLSNAQAQGTYPMVCHVDDHLCAHLAEINKSLDRINQSILESAAADEKFKTVLVAAALLFLGIVIVKTGN